MENEMKKAFDAIGQQMDLITDSIKVSPLLRYKVMRSKDATCNKCGVNLKAGDLCGDCGDGQYQRGEQADASK